MTKKFTAVFWLYLMAYAISTFAQNQPPTARSENVTDDYFGTKIVDPYRWMEDLKADETKQWIKAQADYSRGLLDKLPLRSEFLSDLTKVGNAGEYVRGIQQRGNRYFYYKIKPGEQDNSIYVREGLSGAERLLVNPAAFSIGEKRFSISSFAPSPDGKMLAFLLAPGGGEYGEVRVLEVATGKETGDRIERTRWSAASWMPDGKSFFYFKFQDLAADAPPTEKLQKMRVLRHTLGTGTSADEPVFGYEVNPNLKIESVGTPSVYVPRDSKYALAAVNSGVSPNSDFYVAPLEALSGDAAVIKWRKIAGLEDQVSDFTLRGDDIYLLTYKNTLRYKIVHFNLKNSDLSKAETFFPASEAVVQNMQAANDALYVETLDGGSGKIYRVDYKTKKAELINLPYQGSATLSTDPFDLKEGIYFSITSWTKSSTQFVYHPKTRTATDTKLIPPFPVDLSGIEFVNAKAKSYDGVEIPLVIIYKKGLKTDGGNRTLMLGYGAYGTVFTSPFPQFDYLPWLKRGGILVYAGVRGGGEYGEEWHLAGKEATKPNTWKDFIACGEYLVKEKYTSPAHLGIMGGSAGGILISNSITERPELFGAAISSVGMNNALRSETTANGVSNIAEFGTFKTEAGFKSLLAMDGYDKVKTGAKYPAVMLIHGINDPRVEPWMSAKFAARLQAATTSGKPVLLRIDYDAGHGFGSSQQQFNEEYADIYAFLFEQLK